MKENHSQDMDFGLCQIIVIEKRNQVAHCSVCGRPNARPIGKYCRWCGTRMDQEPLELLSGSHDDIDECTD